MAIVAEQTLPFRGVRPVMSEDDIHTAKIWLSKEKLQK